MFFEMRSLLDQESVVISDPMGLEIRKPSSSESSDQYRTFMGHFKPLVGPGTMTAQSIDGGQAVRLTLTLRENAYLYELYK